MCCNLIQMYFQCLLVRVCMYTCVNIGHWILFNVSNVETIDVLAHLHCRRRTWVKTPDSDSCPVQK